MQFEQRPMLGHRHSKAKQLMLKAAALAAGAILLVSALVLSIVFFAVAIAVVVVVGGYFWWKTRALRKQMRAQFAQSEVIEGAVVRKVVESERTDDYKG